nr:MAG TPA: hypothetical protein [Bacteriophage sp.]
MRALPRIRSHHTNLRLRSMIWRPALQDWRQL